MGMVLTLLDARIPDSLPFSRSSRLPLSTWTVTDLSSETARIPDAGSPADISSTPLTSIVTSRKEVHSTVPETRVNPFGFTLTCDLPDSLSSPPVCRRRNTAEFEEVSITVPSKTVASPFTGYPSTRVPPPHEITVPIDAGRALACALAMMTAAKARAGNLEFIYNSVR
jgi:hypothetical protein